MDKAVGDLAPPPAADPADPGTVSPLQRRIGRLRAAHDPRAFRSWCRVRLTGPVTVPGLAAAAEDVLAALAVPLGWNAVVQADTGSTPGPAAADGAVLRLAQAGHPHCHELLLSLPAMHADVATVLQVTRLVVAAAAGQTPPGGLDFLPHDIAARWWSATARQQEAGATREFWRSRATGWTALSAAATPVVTHLSLDAETSVALRGRASAAGVTTAAWLLACWQVLIRRTTGYSGPTAVATGLRRHAELERCLGPLTPYLPVPASGPLTPGLAERAQAVDAELRAGGERAEWFDWEVTAPGAPDVLPAAFSYLPGLPRWAAGDHTAAVLAVAEGSERPTLDLACVDGDTIALTVTHDGGLLPGHSPGPALETLIRASLADAQAPARALPIVAGDDLGRLRAWSRGPRAPVGGDVIAAVREHAAHTPGRVAVRCGGATLSYAELLAAASALATRLVAAGVGPESRVGILLPRSTELMIAILGVWLAGGAYVPVETDQPAGRVRQLLANARADAVIATEHTAALLNEATGWVPPAGADAPPATGSQPPLVRPGNAACVLFTSGSTGRPRGVVVTHEGLANYLTWAATAFPLSGKAGTLVHTSVAFDHIIPGLFLPLLAGSEVTLLPPGPGEIAALAALLTGGHDFSLVRLTPAHLRALVAHLEVTPHGPVSARLFLIGGEQLTAGLLRRWRLIAGGIPVANQYGPTEAVIARACAAVAEPGNRPAVPIGGPIANTVLNVLDEDLRPVPVGVAGQLYIGGAGLARGYLSQPGATAQRFVPDPHGDGGRMYRTGDIVRWLPSGALEFIGRGDDQVKVRGHRVEPGEIAAVLAGHPAVADAYVTLHPDVPGTDADLAESRLVGYLAAAGEDQPGAEELRGYLAARLPDHLIPSAYVWLAEFPLTSRGKLDRAALPSPAASQAGPGAPFAAPRTPVEAALASIWAEVLGAERVGIHDNFFTLGGDSILSILVAAKAARHGLRVELRLFFERQTIAELAPFVTAAKPAVAPGIAAAGLTPIQHWFREQRLARPGHWNQGWLLSFDRADLTALEAALGDVAAHHPALRTAFVSDGGEWRAEVRDAPVELRRVSIAEDADWDRAVAAELAAMQEFDLGQPPLLHAAVLRSGSRQRLALIAHHLAIDAVSWRIVLDDLVMAYRQRMSGQSVALPAATATPQQWAAALASRAGDLTADLDFWLAQSPPDLEPLPRDMPGPGTERERDEVMASLDAGRTETLLRQLPASIRVDYAVLAALALAVADWTGQPYLHVDVEGQGRVQDIADGIDLYRSVGWFTSVSPLLIPVPAADPRQVLLTVRQQLHAMPHEGIGYGVLRYLHPEGEARLAGLPRPGISFNYVGGGRGAAASRPGQLLVPAPEPLGALQHPDNARPRLLGVNARLFDDQLTLAFDFASSHYRRATVASLGESTIRRLAQVVDTCRGTPPTPEDFPAFAGDEQLLRKVLSNARARRTAPGGGRQ